MKLDDETRTTVTVTDMAEDGGEQDVEVSMSRQAVMIRSPGYSNMGSADGHGWPVLIELYEGELKLYVWSDINQEDPTHSISLEGARESRREET